MSEQGLLQDGAKFAFVTCGDWDLDKMSDIRQILFIATFLFSSAEIARDADVGAHNLTLKIKGQADSRQ